MRRNEHVDERVPRVRRRAGRDSLQPKLEVGRADDPLELEADRTAAIVMQRLAEGISSHLDGDDRPVRRAVQPDGGGDSISAAGGAIDPATERAISASGGTALDPMARSSMESAFGADFSAVRIHTGSKADNLNERLGARAFTTGSDVFVRSGDYSPQTAEGQRLLAHELTHVVQQGGVRRTRRTEPGGAARARPAAPAAQRSAPAAGTIQRIVMTMKQWKKSSSRKGLARSEELLLIDEALMKYNAAQEADPATRKQLLVRLLQRIAQWEGSKLSDEGVIKSKRSDSVAELRNRATAEMDMLEEEHPSADDVEAAGDVDAVATDAHKRAIRVLQSFLAMQPSGANVAKLAGWAPLEQEADRLLETADALGYEDDAGDAEDHALTEAQALATGIAGFRGLSEKWLGTRIGPGRNLTQVQLHLTVLESWVDESTEAGVAAARFIDDVHNDLDRLAVIAGMADAEDDPWEFLDDDRGEMVDELISAFDQGFTLTGYQGTGGLGNEGFQELYKSAPEKGPDTRTGAQQGVQQAFDKLTPGSAAAKDQLSGASDIGSGVVSLGGDVMAILGAVKVVADPASSKAEKREAYATLAKAPLSVYSNAMKITGGALTAKRAGGTLDASDMPDFSASGVDTSTDAKLLGDFAGLATGIIDTIKRVLDVVNHFGDRSAKQKAGDTRKQFESAGLFLKKTTGALVSLSNNAKALMKLTYQIKGGGQAATSTIPTAASQFMGTAVPALNMVMSILDAAQNTYKLTRLGIRRGSLTQKADTMMAGGSDLAELQAVEFAHETLVKRMTRVGLNLGRSLMGIIAGGLNTSGIGLGPGMIVGLASSASSIGQVGVRMAKQKGRNVKAKQRAAKDAERGKEESFEQYKLRQQLAAARTGGKGKRRWEQFRTSMKLQFKFNWDKASANKAQTNKQVALEILRMDDDEIYDALGVKTAVKGEDDEAERLGLVLNALKKRD